MMTLMWDDGKVGSNHGSGVIHFEIRAKERFTQRARRVNHCSQRARRRFRVFSVLSVSQSLCPLCERLSQQSGRDSSLILYRPRAPAVTFSVARQRQLIGVRHQSRPDFATAERQGNNLMRAEPEYHCPLQSSNYGRLSTENDIGLLLQSPKVHSFHLLSIT